MTKELNDLKRALVMQNIGFADKLAKNFNYMGVDAEDLQQEARLAMCQAALRFDPEMGVKFSTFSVKYINGALTYFIKKYGHPSYLREDQRVFYTILSLDEDLSGDNDDDVITLADIIPSDYNGEEAERERIMDRVDEAMGCLDDEERELIESLYAFSGDKDALEHLREAKYPGLTMRQMRHKCECAKKKIKVLNVSRSARS